MSGIALPDFLIDAPVWWRAIEMAIFLGVAFLLGYRLGRSGRSEIKDSIPVSTSSPVEDDFFMKETSGFASPVVETPEPEEPVPPVERSPMTGPPVEPVADDLTKIDGIGPKLASILNENGIVTFKDLAQTSSLTLRKILDNEGPQFKVHDPTYWPRQAALAQSGNWKELKELQSGLTK